MAWAQPTAKEVFKVLTATSWEATEGEELHLTCLSLIITADDYWEQDKVTKHFPRATAVIFTHILKETKWKFMSRWPRDKNKKWVEFIKISKTVKKICPKNIWTITKEVIKEEELDQGDCLKKQWFTRLDASLP